MFSTNNFSLDILTMLSAFSYVSEDFITSPAPLSTNMEHFK